MEKQLPQRKSSTRIEYIQGVPLIWHQKVPMLSDTAQFLYQISPKDKVNYSSKATFDYIDLMINEYLRPRETNRTIDPRRIIASGGRVRTKKNEYPFAPNAYSSFQAETVMRLMEEVFENDHSLFLNLVGDLRSHPDKPLLIVNAHGGIRPINATPAWVVGQELDDFLISANTLLQYVHRKNGSNHYAAIVLVCCNEGKFKPMKLDDTPIYFPIGSALRNKTVAHRAARV